MSLRVNNNTAALNGIRNLQKNDAMVTKNLERLSSGLKINRAADNSAGLIISEQMRAQLTGTARAIDNSQTAVSMLQTAEGALDEVNTLLNKARGLALHAANEGANDNAQLVADQTELDNIMASVDRIAANTQFGTKKLLDGSMSAFRGNTSAITSAATGNHYAKGIQSGTITRGFHSLMITTNATQGNLFVDSLTGLNIVATGADNQNLTIGGMSGTEQFQQTFVVAVNGSQITVVSGSTKNDFITQLNSIGKTLGFVAGIATGGAAAGSTTGVVLSSDATTGDIVLVTKDYGAATNLTLSFVSGATGAVGINSTYTAGVDMSGALLLYSGAVGGTAGSGASAIQLSQSGTTLSLVASSGVGVGYRLNLANLLTLSGANAGSGIYYGVIDGMTSGATFQIGANVGQNVSVEMSSARANDIGQGASSLYKSFGQLGGALTAGNAQEALKVIDAAIDDVTVMRGKLGAFQSNTLETNISSLKVASENLSAAESAIRDVDFAEESAQFTKNNILVQSATAMLAQANQLPQNVLKLLG